VREPLLSWDMSCRWGNLGLVGTTVRLLGWSSPGMGAFLVPCPSQELRHKSPKMVANSSLPVVLIKNTYVWTAFKFSLPPQSMRLPRGPRPLRLCASSRLSDCLHPTTRRPLFFHARACLP